MSEWVLACSTDAVELEGVKRFDHGAKTFAIYRSEANEFFCTDGLCTHEAVHLADGLVFDYEIECPKHAGVFDYRTGEAKGLPACIKLKTYATRVEDEQVFIHL